MFVKPKPLRKGDTIGIIAPASPTFDRTDLMRSIQVIKDWGFRCKLGRNVNKKHGYLSGKDWERVEDLNEMFRDKGVRAILCLQGGYGSMRLLPYIDYNSIRKNPKIFIGYSDITALHLAINKLTGLVTFHGPSMVGLAPPYLSKYTKDYLFRALTKKKPIGQIKPSPDDPWVWTITPGKAQGVLVGGNLSLIAASLGTPYEIETRGKILFLEEVDVEPYHFDQMLTQLLLAGKLKEAKGIVIGECVRCVPADFRPGYYSSLSIEDVLVEIVKPLNIPAVYNLPIGHGDHRATLPLGVMATLDAGKGKLIVTETALS
ncbi:LD-carboxypeptidase [Candidatus Woesearchaeota archaeon]|nr:LD-carboxypeptidase [Candidatus Woesearchaeota archaeon]